MKTRKPPILTAKDLANIRTLIQQECLQANKEVRKEIRQLRKENTRLRTMPKIIRFLLGETSMNGYWFGDTYVNDPPYWWRKALRKLYSPDHLPDQGTNEKTDND